MASLLEKASIMNLKIQKAIDRLLGAWNISASTDKLAISKEMSVRQVNKDFNNMIQTYFLMSQICDFNHEIRDIVDTGPAYSRRALFLATGAKKAKNHGYIWRTLGAQARSPCSFSADLEFCKESFESFLSLQTTKLKDRSALSSQRSGIIEKNHTMFKSVHVKIGNGVMNVLLSPLVSRSSLLTNLIHGYSTGSAFQLAKNYTPSLLGLSSFLVTEEVINACKEASATHGIRRTLKFIDPKTSPKRYNKEISQYLGIK